MFSPESFNLEQFWSAGGLLLFPHVPKTSGTSIQRILAECLDPAEIFFFAGELQPRQREFDRLRQELPDDTRKVRLIFGHMSFGLHVLFPERQVKYVTIVRDPVDRIASHYLHELHHHIRQDYGELLLSNDGAVTFINAFEAAYGSGTARWAHNHQCQLLFPDLIEPMSWPREWCNDNDNFLQELKALASKWYVLIGTQEKHDEFVSRLCSLFGKDALAQKVNENTRYRGASRQILSASERLTIEGWNKLDRILFNFLHHETDPKPVEDAPSDNARMGLLADVRLKALQYGRSDFMALNADRQKAQAVMNSQHNTILRLTADLDRERNLRQKLENAVEALLEVYPIPEKKS